jgi:hypothetical protein
MNRDETSEETTDPELLELEAELRAAKDAAEEAEAARTKVSRMVDLRDQIETNKRRAVEETALQAAIEKHGALGVKIARVDVPKMGMFIVSRPDPIKIKRYYEKVQKDDVLTLDETWETARPYIVFPTRERADQLYAESPLIASSLSNAAMKLAGLRLEAIGGK